MHKISSLIYPLFNRFFPGRFSQSGFLVSANNVQWVGLSRVASMAVSFITTAIVARTFGPENFGTLNYVLSFVGLFSMFASLGVSAILYKEIIRNKEERELLIGSGMMLTCIAGIATILLLSVYLYFSQETLAISLMILLASISFLTQPLNLLQMDFLKDSEARYATITQLITYFISNISKIFVVWLYQSIWLFILILVLENLVAGAIYVYQIKKIKGRTLNLTYTWNKIGYFFYHAIPYAVSLGLTDIYARIDQVMLKHYLDVSTVGIYAAAAKVTELWYFIPNMLITGLFPVLAKASLSKGERTARFRLLSKWLFLVGVIITILIFFTSKWVITLIYGESFLPATTILSIYILSLPGTFVSILALQELFVDEKPWKVVLIPGGTALLNIALNFFLIPLYGAAGAAIATVISYNSIPLIFYIIKRNSR
jgi:O-antigen/teichoic acid export membrane protein